MNKKVSAVIAVIIGMGIGLILLSAVNDFYKAGALDNILEMFSHEDLKPYISSQDYLYGNDDALSIIVVTNNSEKAVDVKLHMEYKNENFNYLDDETYTMCGIAPSASAIFHVNKRYHNAAYYGYEIAEVKKSQYTPVVLNENFFVEWENNGLGDITYTIKNECGKTTKACYITAIFMNGTEIVDVDMINAFDGEIPDGKRVNDYAETTLLSSEYDQIQAIVHAYY